MIAIISDTHFGVRRNSKFFMNVQERYFKNEFFPYIDKHNITKIIHLGDIFNSRKSINYETLKHARDCFINPIIDRGITLHLIVGNHDSFYNDNHKLVSPSLLFDKEENIRVYDTTECVDIDGCVFLMVPWMHNNEYIDAIENTQADVCCGHFEIIGELKQFGHVNDDGVDRDIFRGFKHVFSGHFHIPSDIYVGSPYKMTWGDYQSKNRIQIFDTDTGTVKNIFTKENPFIKIEYDESEVDENFFELCRNKIVELSVLKKEDVKLYDTFISSLDAVNPYKIDIKNKYLYISKVDVDDDIDTISIFLASIDDSNFSDKQKKNLKMIISDLYDRVTQR